MNLKQLLFTKDDAIVVFNLVCAICGIGTLGMPANFARAGPLYGVLAIVFMGITNTYSSIALSKTMLMAPKSVKTYGDLGDWCMGRFGRYAVVISQMLVCTLGPTAFLVLGGTMLDSLFPNAFSQTFWIVFMAIMCLPVCLTPTLKEGAGAALAGCIGTIVADVVGVGMLIHGMKGHPSVPSPHVTVEQTATVFGNLALAYAAATVIPSLQRQHRQPERMPQVITITMVIITLMFVALAGAGYSAVGCQISGNLLFSVFPDSTGHSSLGMKADFGAAVIAYLFMQLHVTIAFSVFLFPVFFTAERLILGMHKNVSADMSELPYRASETPKESAKYSVLDEPSHEEGEIVDYRGAGTTLKYVTLRVVIIVILVIVAVVLQGKFVDLSDFIGSSCITACCIVLPIVLYQKKMGSQLPTYERVFGIVVALISAGLGVYSTYKTGKNLFAPESGGPVFPYCKAENSMELYYMKP